MRVVCVCMCVLCACVLCVCDGRVREMEIKKIHGRGVEVGILMLYVHVINISAQVPTYGLSL